MNTKKTIRIATRNSPLAMIQAEMVKSTLQQVHSGLTIELIGMTTTGDRKLETALAKIGGKGLFIKELEQAILDGRADIAVHSMKDVPANLLPDLVIGAVLPREDPRDVFVANNFSQLDHLPRGAKIGTSSLRRQCQIKAQRPDLLCHTLRGNVQTRLNKLDAQEFDAIILAAAGLKRLDLIARIKDYLPTNIFIPAVGQGIIGIECKASDAEILDLLAPLNHTPTAACILAERAFNQALEGSCQVPVGAYASFFEDEINLLGMVGSPDGGLVIRGQLSSSASNPQKIGKDLAEVLLRHGVKNILKECAL